MRSEKDYNVPMQPLRGHLERVQRLDVMRVQA